MTYAYWFKYIMVGDYSRLEPTADVGKSSILRRFIDSTFKSILPPTTSPEFISQVIIIDDLPIKIEVWDTSGSEAYQSITRGFYKNSAGCFLVYDISNRNSFVNILRWYDEAKNNSNHENMTFILIGNKTDLEAK